MTRMNVPGTHRFHRPSGYGWRSAPGRLLPAACATLRRLRLTGVLAALLALLLLAPGCGGGEEAPAATLAGPGDLQGKTIYVQSLGDALTLETRFVLQEAYGLDVSLNGGDVTFKESLEEELPDLLRDGTADAVVMAGLGAFRLQDDEDFHVISRITEEMRGLTGAPVMDSVLVTYRDVAQQKNGALSEVTRMLAESVTYFKANQDEVIEAVAGEGGVDKEFLRWWWERQDLLLGDRSVEAQEQILDVWQAAAAIGDIKDVPDMASVLFTTEDEQAEAVPDGDRTTVSIAVLDHPSRHAALYAIEQGIVSSDSVDLDLTYLVPSEIVQAAPARQYDVIEAMPLIVPQGEALDVDFVVLSAALQNLDGTLLLVASDAGRR